MSPTAPDRHVGAPAGRRDDVLTLLRSASGPLGVGQIADRLGIHPNTVRFHLAALTDQGRVEQLPPEPSGPGRPAQRYRACRGMDPHGPRNYRLLAQILADNLARAPHPGEAAVEAGRAFGHRLVDPDVPAPRTDRQSMHRLVGVLDELDFAPQVPAGRRPVIELHHCPFLELASADDTTVVCRIHLGLMQGASAALGGRMAVDGLERFVEPDLCVAHLSSNSRRSTRGPSAPQTSEPRRK